MSLSKGALAAFALLPLAHAADPAPIQRHRPVGSTFPIASAVEVPAGRSLVFLSGMVPPVVDDKAERGSLAAYGDTRTQTQGVLKAIERQLQAQGLGMGDVVKMQVFLVGDPAKGRARDREAPAFAARHRHSYSGVAQPCEARGHGRGGVQTPTGRPAGVEHRALNSVRR